jgi:hypothetical protein
VGSKFGFQHLGDDWVVEMEWREGDYDGGPAGMWIRPADPDSPPAGGLSSTVLRRIDFRTTKAKLLKELATNPHGWRGSPERQKELDADRVEKLRLQLANGVTPEYLALLASNYIHRVKSGQPKPVERLAEDLGRPLQTIRGHLWRARKDKLLKGSPGRKGGELSIEAMTILQQLQRRSKADQISTQPTSLI